MTRFARAKGSKASNERREEEATPWHVMRQQLAEQLSNNQAPREVNTQSYNLKEILNNGTKSHKEEVWSDFGETKFNLKNNLKSTTKKNSNEKCEVKKRKVDNMNESVAMFSSRDSVEANASMKKTLKVEDSTIAASERSLKDRILKSKKVVQPSNKSKQGDETETADACKEIKSKFVNVESLTDKTIKRIVKDDSDGIDIALNSSKKHKLINKIESGEITLSKKNKKRKLRRSNVFIETHIEPKASNAGLEGSTDKSKAFEKPRTGEKKSKQRMKNNDTEVQLTENNLNRLQKPNGNIQKSFNCSNNEKQSSESNKNDIFKPNKQNHSSYPVNNNYSNSTDYDFYKGQYRKNNFSKYPHERSVQTIIANGREIHVIKYQGFLVKKDDADELKKLRKKLLAQNIPKEKLETIMKLERRKAEKALAREKKKVCYHCRQFGHNFSDCPEIKDSDMVKTGVCFKCGSLEHSHFECKVLQHQEFRHAVCFVCKEQGHIARQCPLNSQGLYPKGGSCHLCGEVTHLRKDCPKAVEEKVSKSVTVGTLKDGRVEDIGGQSFQQQETTSNKKKVIKFK